MLWIGRDIGLNRRSFGKISGINLMKGKGFERKG